MQDQIENLSTYMEGNKVEHALARMTLEMEGEMIWMEESPQNIYSIVLNEKECNNSLFLSTYE